MTLYGLSNRPFSSFEIFKNLWIARFRWPIVSVLVQGLLRILKYTQLQRFLSSDFEFRQGLEEHLMIDFASKHPNLSELYTTKSTVLLEGL